jgi:hypothetical protein
MIRSPELAEMSEQQYDEFTRLIDSVADEDWIRIVRTVRDLQDAGQLAGALVMAAVFLEGEGRLDGARLEELLHFVRLGQAFKERHREFAALLHQPGRA